MEIVKSAMDSMDVYNGPFWTFLSGLFSPISFPNHSMPLSVREELIRNMISFAITLWSWLEKQKTCHRPLDSIWTDDKRLVGCVSFLSLLLSSLSFFFYFFFFSVFFFYQQSWLSCIIGILSCLGSTRQTWWKRYYNVSWWLTSTPGLSPHLSISHQCHQTLTSPLSLLFLKRSELEYVSELSERVLISDLFTYRDSPASVDHVVWGVFYFFSFLSFFLSFSFFFFFFRAMSIFLHLHFF